MDRRHFLIGSAGLPAAASLGRLSDSFGGLPPCPPDTVDEAYWRALRWYFHIPKDHAYCNSGTLGASPKVVTNAIRDHQEFLERNLSSATYQTGHRTFLGGYQDEPELRTRLGKLMGCSMQETALTRNATMGMSYVAMGLQLGRGDEVLMSDQEHAGGRSAYDVRAKREGLRVLEAELPLPCDDPAKVVAAYAAKLTKRTRVVSIPHMTSRLGLLLPVKQIIAAVRAHDPNLFVVVDGAQTLGQVPVNVKDLDCDAFFSSPHKWLLAPKGSGVLYVRKERNEEVWTTIANSMWDFQADVGRRFSQIGTGNQSLHMGFAAALDFLERIGIDRIHKRIKALGDRLRTGLQKIDGIKIASSVHPAMCAGMTNYEIRGWEPKAANQHLFDTEKIMPRAAGKGLRQSLHIYNSFDHVDRTLSRLAKMV